VKIGYPGGVAIRTIMRKEEQGPHRCTTDCGSTKITDILHDAVREIPPRSTHERRTGCASCCGRSRSVAPPTWRARYLLGVCRRDRFGI